MISTDCENLPASWDDARDIPFFRITASLFTAEFCFGAGALLASYDDDTTDPGTSAPSAQSPSIATAGATDQPTGELIPVRVRRIA
jgi:hypothetical protein